MSPLQEEAFVHELLHIEMVRRGYPRYRPLAVSEAAATVCGSLVDLADHAVTRPLFGSLGYDPSRFLEPGGGHHGPLGQSLVSFLGALDPDRSPEDFGSDIEGLLNTLGIEFAKITVSPAP